MASGKRKRLGRVIAARSKNFDMDRRCLESMYQANHAISVF